MRRVEAQKAHLPDPRLLTMHVHATVAVVARRPRVLGDDDPSSASNAVLGSSRHAYVTVMEVLRRLSLGTQVVHRHRLLVQLVVVVVVATGRRVGQLGAVGRGLTVTGGLSGLGVGGARGLEAEGGLDLAEHTAVAENLGDTRNADDEETAGHLGGGPE